MYHQCLKVASENNLVDSIINIAANCLNSAISAEKNNCEQNNKKFHSSKLGKKQELQCRYYVCYSELFFFPPNNE